MERSEEKRSYLPLIAVLLLLLVMVCLIMISGTYAKYTTTVNGEDTATVAKWAWDINGTALTNTTTTYTLDLFETINDSDGTTDEEDVADERIAPGTSGSFDIEITNNSEVDAQYSSVFTLEGADGINLEFSTDGGTTWSDALEAVDATDIAMNETKTITVMWRWAFEEGDTDDEKTATDVADTAIGFAAASGTTVTVNASVTFVQVD